jgi:hypothetical protein
VWWRGPRLGSLAEDAAGVRPPPVTRPLRDRYAAVIRFARLVDPPRIAIPLVPRIPVTARALVRCLPLGALLALPAARARAQEPTQAERPSGYPRLTLRGYSQLRTEGLVGTRDSASCDGCAPAIDQRTGYSARRGRLVLSGALSERVSIYVQPELAPLLEGRVSATMRDAYVDVAVDRAQTLVLRVGQGKIPFGWENLQSSSRRLPLERAAATRSAFSSERDLTAFARWAPPHVRARLKLLSDSGLRGSGDYGMVAAGAFNGAGANNLDFDRHVHTFARVTYPFLLRGGRVVEAGLQGYAGRFVMPGAARVTADDAGLVDRRVAASVVAYPQPFGVQAEWTVGRGPSADASTGMVRARPLQGGYVQAMYRGRVGGDVVLPFVRASRYDGGEKFQDAARRDHTRDLDAGIEWEASRAIELTAMYTRLDHRSETLTRVSDRERVHVARFQVQVNY